MLLERPGAQGSVKLGPRKSQKLRGSPELKKGGLRMEDSRIGGLRGLAKLRMAGFWMHQVLCIARWLRFLARFGTDKKSKNPSSLQDWPGIEVFPAILGCRVSRLLDQPSGPLQCDQRWCYVHRFVVRFFVSAFWSISSPGGSRRCRAASKEVSGGQGKPRAPERWPESSGRCLDDDFPIEV